jgi:hypothetical protein
VRGSSARSVAGGKASDMKTWVVSGTGVLGDDVEDALGDSGIESSGLDAGESVYLASTPLSKRGAA